MFKSPLVVGYKGEIGSFILKELLRVMPKASDIWAFDVESSRDEMFMRIEKSHEIFLCTPIQSTRDWLSKWRNALKGKVIFEQCSIKAPILEGFDDLDIRSMHLLFRPSATLDPADRTVAFVKKWDEGLAKSICELTNAYPTHYDSVEEHDMDMALKQGLTHRILLKLAEIHARFPGAGRSAETYMSRQVRKLAERIQAGDPVLYQWIQSNRHLQPIVDSFVRELQSDGRISVDLPPDND